MKTLEKAKVKAVEKAVKALEKAQEKVVPDTFQNLTSIQVCYTKYWQTMCWF